MKNIQDLLESNPTVCITVRMTDLLAFGDYLIQQTSRKASKLKEEEETLLTSKEFQKAARISPATLWRREKDGTVKSILIGGKRLYPKRELIKLLGGE